MNIENYMTKELITVGMDDDLAKVKKILTEHNIHHVLIIDEEGVLFGVITDSDLFKHLSPNIGTMKETLTDGLLLNQKAHLIMTRELVVIKKQLSIKDAVALFYEKNVSCLPVVDKNNKAIGIITWRDIIKIIALQHKSQQAQTIKPATP